MNNGNRWWGAGVVIPPLVLKAVPLLKDERYLTYFFSPNGSHALWDRFWRDKVSFVPRFIMQLRNVRAQESCLANSFLPFFGRWNNDHCDWQLFQLFFHRAYPCTWAHRCTLKISVAGGDSRKVQEEPQLPDSPIYTTRLPVLTYFKHWYRKQEFVLVAELAYI